MSLPVALNPDGSSAGLNLDGSGNLKCSVTGAGSGGTSAVDGATFTAGTSAGTPLMAEDPTTGELLVAQMSPGTRQLLVAASVSVAAVTSNTASTPAQTTVGTTAAQVLAANSGRKRLMLQNVGTTTIFITYGSTNPTTSAFHFALPAGGSTGDGSSRIQEDTMWTGAVRGISSAAGGLLSITELT
jgi:hypothetical protein